MIEEDINELLKRGWWVSVSPVMSNGKWSFTCGIYKRYKKSGNWTTESCKTFRTPHGCYKWAMSYFEKQMLKK